MIKPAVKDETSRLRMVVLGLADDFGGTPSLHDVYDPKSKEHIVAGTYPDQESISHEMHHLEEVFHKYDVKLLRPDNIPGVNQIFARDIGFVIVIYYNFSFISCHTNIFKTNSFNISRYANC